MPEIQFTQYSLPNGRRSQILLDVDDETYAKAESLRKQGLVFEAEFLRNGMVSFTICDPVEEVDLDIRLSSNGPEMLTAVKDLIINFNRVGG